MATQIKLIAQSRDGSGTLKTFDYKPGAKHAADSNSIYKVVVDGQSELPPGTKIARDGNSVVFHFPDGTIFEIENWCSISDSRLTDLNNTQAYSADQSAYVDAKQIDSGACVIWGEGGQAAAVLGDSGASSGAATSGTSAASSDDHLVPGIIAGVLALGAIAALSHGGDGSSNGPAAGTPDALNEDFAPVAITSATVKAGDDHTAQNQIQLLSAKIKSATGFNVVVDNNPLNDGSDDVQIVDVNGVPTLQVNPSGENKFGTIVATVQLKDASGNVTTQDVTFTVNPVNDKPVNHVPTNPIIDPQDDFTIDASNLLILSVSDVDEATGPDAHKIGSVNLTVTGGTGAPPENITLNAAGTAVQIDNNGTKSVTLTGTEAELNTVLATVVYTSDGTTDPRQITMTMTTTDKDGETLDIDDILINMSGLGGLSHGGGGSVGLTALFASEPAPHAASRAAPSSISVATLIGDLHDPALHSG